MSRLEHYINEGDIEQPTDEMVKFYEKRTNDHIKRVQTNIKRIIKAKPELNKDELLKRLKDHDKSKYSKDERIPYIWLSWWHKERNAGRKFNYPQGIKEIVKKAAKGHVYHNKHHPESHNDITKMTNIDLAEMVADWAAMSQELGGSTKKWADDNVGKKWKFTKDQTEFIYNIIKVIE